MDNLIHQVYVISKNGPLFFARTFIKGVTTADPDLSSGLITALFHFTRDTHDKMINVMNMQDLKMVFQESETLLFAATVDTRLSDRDAVDVLANIRDFWLLQYGEQKEATVDRSKFEPFGEDVERIIVGNLWWLGKGRQFSVRNQGRFLKETVSRPSRVVGARYLANSYLLTPILIVLGTIFISFILGGQVMGWNMQFIEMPSFDYLVTMTFNIFAAWLIMAVMTTAINQNLPTLRQTILSAGYVMIFQLVLFFFASKFYVDIIFGFVYPGFGSLSFQERLFLLNDPSSPIIGLTLPLWQLPATVFIFAWLVLFAYVTYNIQRPKPLQHVLAIAVSFVFLYLIQSAVYWLFFQTFLLTPAPLGLMP